MAPFVAAMPVSFQSHLWLFTVIILIHNVFSATQDVAIDALAVNVLRAEERGLANGLMFGGNYVGIALGGSGVLLLTPLIGFRTTFLLVAGAIALVNSLGNLGGFLGPTLVGEAAKGQTSFATGLFRLAPWPIAGALVILIVGYSRRTRSVAPRDPVATVLGQD